MAEPLAMLGAAGPCSTGGIFDSQAVNPLSSASG